MLGFPPHLVGPVLQPIIPVLNNTPGYFKKITTFIDLGIIKAKIIDRNEYTSEWEFEKNRRQMLKNYYKY